ncbi:MAG: Nramp family divalent metal transporter [Candidatus Nealsonbacteria bacterium]|nr:Nramp family divalent metal transporter [Candidatus Nealsonbacteria bacterium]
MYELDPNAVEAPPQTVRGILGRLGPGLIIAGSIVGSGELIATTKTGAQAGFWLLWLILIGCVIKLFAQVEFGRYAISSGKTAMAALNEVPGPRLRVNWLVGFWFVMFLFAIGQLGGILGGVGQSLAMNVPINGSLNRLLEAQDTWDAEAKPIRKELRAEHADDLASDDPKICGQAEEQIDKKLQQAIGGARPGSYTEGFFWTDDVYWAILIAVASTVLLVVGRYALIQNVSMFFVASFTVVTVFCVFGLQFHDRYALQWPEVAQGLTFRLPPAVEGLARSPLATALATFGIIGVGATELISYPYWCLEKGYARFAGPRDDSPEWAGRARGWLRVMRWDASISMVIFTFATVAFYLLGAAVLHKDGVDPEGNQMIRALSLPYVEVFGPWARWLFLFGAIAVLYSTFFVAIAGHTRVAADALRVFRFGVRTEPARMWWIRLFCVLFPMMSLTIYICVRKPVWLVLASGFMQAIMLPMLGAAALYFRYRRCDRRITPGPLWDLMLWLSAAGLLLAGGWLALTKLFPALEQMGQ